MAGEFSQFPIDAFTLGYCRICANRDCSRSVLSNTLSFDKRATGWHDNLFRKVPRAAENDPAYAHIRSKNFQSVNEQRPINISSNRVPDRFSHPEENVVGPQDLPPEGLSVEQTEAMMNPPDGEEAIAEPPPPVPTKINIPQSIPSNTAFAEGTILKSPSGAPEKEIILKPGDSYTFGGSDEK